MAKILWKIKQY